MRLWGGAFAIVVAGPEIVAAKAATGISEEWNWRPAW